jgi:predicted Zn-dependent peptidase
MPAALKLLEEVLHNAKADKDSYDQFVALTLKDREDAKKDQRTCFDYLYNYGVYGPHNMRRADMTADELHQADPQQLLGLLANLSGLQHSVLYYGPMSQKELSSVVTKLHKTPKQLAAVPHGQPYTKQLTPQNEIWIAPYDAKNIYMRMFHNEGRDFNPDETATITLFNEYYGGGMNGIVFQELREARGLAYNAGANYGRISKKGEKESFFTHIITQNDKMMDCVRQFHSILDTIPQSEAAFKIAKDAVQKQLASIRTTKMGVINLYLAMKRLGLDYDLNKKMYDDLQGVSLQDIVRFEQQQMARKPFRYLILGDEKELDMPSLEKIGPIRRLSLEDIFGY